LDAAPELTLDQIRARDAVRLNTYGWVNQESGVVHIPIEEAMRRMLESGVPARNAPVPDFGLGDAFRMDSSGGTLPVRGAVPEENEGAAAGEEHGEDAADDE
jgi:hypothetical protein